MSHGSVLYFGFLQMHTKGGGSITRIVRTHEEIEMVFPVPAFSLD